MGRLRGEVELHMREVLEKTDEEEGHLVVCELCVQSQWVSDSRDVVPKWGEEIGEHYVPAARDRCGGRR